MKYFHLFGVFVFAFLIISQFLIIGVTAISMDPKPVSPVYISEINYAGSVQQPCNSCAYDKWIELYNPSGDTIPLTGYSLRFQNSLSAGMNLDLSGHSIQGRSYFLIANKRSGMSSNLSTISVQPDMFSGKVLSVSNNSSKIIQVTLLHSDMVIDDVQISSSTLHSLESSLTQGSKGSLEKISGSWRISSQEYTANNFGTPKGYINATPVETTPQPAIVADDFVEEDIIISHSTLASTSDSITAIQHINKPAYTISEIAHPAIEGTETDYLQAEPDKQSLLRQHPLSNSSIQLRAITTDFNPVISHPDQNLSLISDDKPVLQSDRISLPFEELLVVLIYSLLGFRLSDVQVHKQSKTLAYHQLAPISLTN